MPHLYSAQFREQAVQKVLTGSDSKMHIAKQMGVATSTLHRWLREAKHSGESVMTKHEKRPQDWPREARLNALIEASQLSEEELGAWCRQKGLHTHHLEKWRKEFSKEHQPGDQDNKARQLKKENKELKKELNRKDKALAETSALLVLKKKADAIWGDNEED